MRTHLARYLPTLAALALLLAAPAARGSGASFVITGKGITLGKPEEVTEKGKTLARFKAKAEVGKPFTLVARGVVFPRGAVKGQPAEPDSGSWAFDAKQFKKLAPDRKAEKSEVVLTLDPTAAGPARVRFTGKILGHERTFEVLVEVAAKKE